MKKMSRAAYDMEDEKVALDVTRDAMDWAAYEKCYDEWQQKGARFFGIKYPWVTLKKGIKEKVIEVTPLRPAVDYPELNTFLACSQVVKMTHNTAKFLYPSPYVLFNADFSNSNLDVDFLYCIANKNEPSLVLAGFDTNRGVDNAKALPKEVCPPLEYFADWENNSELAIYWFDFQNAAKDAQSKGISIAELLAQRWIASAKDQLLQTHEQQKKGWCTIN